ncbi:MAG TPA: glycosyltransferase family 2 protein [Pyrinomonadaceae bacterium]|nr:glycosyltransferase family 2 protein [Pyrinomonadaceae bacterium]
MPQTTIPAPISVVIPAHNAERFIQQAIGSVHAQTLPVTELIVVADDCSDNTQSIAKSLGATVVEIKARNISAARNAGVRAAAHKWIAFLDSDDFWKADKIERQWKALESFPDAAVVSCDFYIIYEGTTRPPSEKGLRLRRDSITCPVVITEQGTYFSKVDGRVLRWFEIAPQAVMIRRDVFDTAGFFDEQLVFLQDIEYFARALRDHSLVMVEEPLVYRRMRPDSHSANTEAKWTAHFSIVDRMLRHPDQYPPLAGEEYRDHLKFVFASNERAFAEKHRRQAASQNATQPQGSKPAT